MGRRKDFMEYRQKKVTIITGDYGSGKTNLAVNLAVRLSEIGRTAVVDIDTVNPYFRTADFAEVLSAKGISVAFPQFANTNLDIPVLDFDLEEIISANMYTIIDAGGADAGAFPLGRYNSLFRSLGDDIEVLFVYNMYRSPEYSAEDAVKSLREIERASRLSCTALVNNSNLGVETTAGTVGKSAAFAAEVSRLSGIPTTFTCVTDDCADEAECDGFFPVKRLVKLPWEIFTEGSEYI